LLDAVEVSSQVEEVGLILEEVGFQEMRVCSWVFDRLEDLSGTVVVYKIRGQFCSARVCS
jgi:hypothetical protein